MAVAVALFDTRTPLAPLRDELRRAVEEVIDEGRFILGPRVQAFESLQQLGMDPNKLSYFYSGLDQKLVGVEGAEPIQKIIA